jgi:hypothetical protein
VALALGNKKGKHIIVSKIEDFPVLHSAQALEKQGFRVTYLDMDEDGFVNLDQLRDSITNETILVSIQHANQEIGTMQDIEAISHICRGCSRQRTVGCEKPSIEDGCMLKCEKSTTITNTNGVSFAVDKQKGGYPSIYNNEQFLNVDIVNDLGDLFDEFFIDLTDIGSGSKAEPDKAQLITQFENILNGDENAQQNLHQMVTLSTRNQYRKGL